jgi:hypothetical protein
MAGYSKFQKAENKYTRAGMSDIYKKGINPSKFLDKLSKNQKLREGFKLWTSFYRANPHRFIEDYFGIKLFLFQKILVYMLFHVDFFMNLAARGGSKSWLIAVVCCARCVLYPGTMIILASGTKGQARIIVSQKIHKMLMRDSPNLAREIKEVKTSLNETVVYFQNGSTIEAVTSTDSSRGFRGNLLVFDEFRLIDLDILNKVLRNFATVPRQPPYLKKLEYSHLVEENKEVYISSAHYKNHWMYEKFRSFVTQMCKGRDYFVSTFDYKLALFHGLLSQKQIEQKMSEPDFDAIAFLMESECLFWGESENAFYKLNDIQKCRTLLKPFYPLSNVEFLDSKNKRKKSTKQSGEIRIIGVDIAVMGGQSNDNTVFTCIRLLPSRGEYLRDVSYIESLNGGHPDLQAIRLKQIYHDFEADYVAMDTQGASLNVYDSCAKVLYDTERDVEYPAWCAMNNEKMEARALDKNALPVIFSIKVVQRENNHEIAMFLKNCFEQKKIRLLVDEIRGREFLDDNKEYIKSSPEDKANMELPYFQTTALVNELVNLEYEISGGFVRFKKSSARKDRFSSLAYGIYYSKILEMELFDQSDEDDYNFFMSAGF